MSFDPLSQVRPVPAGSANATGAWVASAGDANLATVDARGFRSVSFVLGMQVGPAGAANIFLERSDNASAWEAVPIVDIRGRSSSAAATDGLLGTLTALGGKMVHVTTPVTHRYYRVRQGNSAAAAGFGCVIALLADAMMEPVGETAW